MSLIFAWGLKFLLAIVVWCTCPLRHPETGQNKDRVQVSFISHLLPKTRGPGIKVLEVTGLGEPYDNLAWSPLRCYLLCWNTPKTSLPLCPLQGGHMLFALQGMCRVG